MSLYGDLKGARERLCRVQVALEHPAQRQWLDEAVERIDRVGAFLPEWSKFDLPSVDDPSEGSET